MRIKQLIIFLIIFFIIIFNLNIFFHKVIFRNVIFMLNQPKDLYDFIVNERIDIIKKGTYNFEFVNKYDGKHSVGIILENFLDSLYFSKSNFKLRLKIDFYLKERLVFSNIKNVSYPFKGKKGSGFIFLTYSCPSNLPRNQLIICKVTIIEPDYELFKKYGPVRFYVQKMSDE